MKAKKLSLVQNPLTVGIACSLLVISQAFYLVKPIIGKFTRKNL